MMKEAQRPLLVTCLGDNPASAVVAGRHFGVGGVLAIVTDRTRKLVAVIQEQLRVPVSSLVHDSEREGFAALAYRVRDEIANRAPGGLIVDVTGGTKLMGIGAFVGAELLRRDETQVVYLKANGRLADARQGAEIPCEVCITPQEVLAWYGARITRVAWTGGPRSPLPQQVLERSDFSRLLFNLFGESKIELTDAPFGGFRLKEGTWAAAWPGAMPPDLECSDNVIHDPTSDYLKKNVWLEQLCLLQALGIANASSSTQLVFGCHVAVENTTELDEVDVLVVRGARVCAIEAKGRFVREGVGAELQKRIHKTRRFLGQQAKVIFVHPTWGAKPPKSLVESSGAGVYLIGNDLEAFDRAIAEALDLAPVRRVK